MPHDPFPFSPKYISSNETFGWSRRMWLMATKMLKTKMGRMLSAPEPIGGAIPAITPKGKTQASRPHLLEIAVWINVTSGLARSRSPAVGSHPIKARDEGMIVDRLLYPMRELSAVLKDLAMNRSRESKPYPSVPAQLRDRLSRRHVSPRICQRWGGRRGRKRLVFKNDLN